MHRLRRLASPWRADRSGTSSDSACSSRSLTGFRQSMCCQRNSAHSPSHWPVNAVVGTPWLLGLIVGVIGAGSSVGAQLSSVAGRFANPHCRATVLGVVTAGISAGILAGPIVGGWLSDEIGWCGMLLVFATACTIVAVSAFFVLPSAAGEASHRGTSRRFAGSLACMSASHRFDSRPAVGPSGSLRSARCGRVLGSRCRSRRSRIRRSASACTHSPGC